MKFVEEGLEGDHVLLHLDARSAGVEVPSHLMDNPSLTLKISYLFQGKTEVGESGITSYLRFGGDYFKCVVPWTALWGVTTSGQKNQIWPEDLPKEVVIQLAKAKISELGKKIFRRKGKTDEVQEADSIEESKVEEHKRGKVKVLTQKKQAGKGAKKPAASHLTRVK